MKKIYFSGLFILINFLGFSQKKYLQPKSIEHNVGNIEFMKGKMVVCPGNFEEANTYVPFDKTIEEALKNNKARTTAPKSTFIVTYVGFSPAAQKAFQAAVDIWANILSSPVPIRITATWRAIDSGSTGGTILGQASPADFTRNFPGQQKANTWYPIALAEKIAGQELNSINEPDIVADFNSSAPWYLGLASPGANEFDFTSVVLHELCHGLGFTASLRVNDNKATWGYGTGSPFVYDYYLENNLSQRLIDTTNFKNSSVVLKDQVTSDNIFYNSPTAIQKTGEKPRIYAPITYEAGSSISHLNDATYPSGNANSLMTAGASLREVIRDPGAIVKGIFADMGWQGTSLVHTRLKNIENSVSKVTIKAKVLSDTSIVDGSVLVFFSENDTISKAKPIVMTRIGNTDEYAADIPVTKSQSIIRYYLTATDNKKNKVFAPAEAPLKGYYGFSVGYPDLYEPYVSTSPFSVIPTNASPDIFANIEDSYEHGIDTAYVEYKINGGGLKTAPMKRYDTQTDNKAYSQGRNDKFAFLAKTPFGTLKQNDRVLYRIIAIDKSQNKNKKVLPSFLDTPGTDVKPSPDFFEFVVSDLKPNAVSVYTNNFDANSDDFATINGWAISQPNGFTSGGLHSPHPYKNGGDENFETNSIALLRTPIILKDNVDSATITFDEVVLVEPGETSATFGDYDFYDYVVVEGSYDGGQSWIPFEDGYDANANSAWVKAFNGSGINGTFVGADGKSYQTFDSKATGNANLFRKRTIKMLSSGDFESGEKILIRFRLLSDQLTYGWGWAIDNLNIQVPPPPPILAKESPMDKSISIYPNPSPESLKIALNLSKPGKVKMEILDTKGTRILSKELNSESNVFVHQLDLSGFDNGSYLVKLNTENGFVVRRFIVNR